MTTTIKITELTNIGSNLASSTVIPVVNMGGTPTTEKTVLGNIANVVLAGAGGNYVSAAKATTATTANTVLTNAQPNITSTGNLTGLTVSNATGVVNFSNTANVTLGNVSNLHIAGGTAGQLLSTNGNGTLSWASDTTTYGNSNVVSLLSAFGSNTISTTGNISVGNITATNLGNVSTINRDGNSSNVLYGNGVFAPVAGGGANTGNVTFDNQAVVGTGDQEGGGGLYLAPGTESVGNLQYLRVRGGDVATHIHLDTGDNGYFDQYFGDDGKYVKLESGGNISIGTNTHNWTFGLDGNLSVPGGILGTGNLKLSPDSTNVASYLDIFLTSGPDLHLVASASANLILGKDNGPNVMTSWDGNVYIQSWDGSNASIWSFNEDGSTIFPTLTTQRGDNPSGTITGQTLLFGDAAQEAIISTADGTVGNENSQRLVINPGQGYDYGEGGDIYLWAGRGGDGSGSGGDIKIRGGQGGANTTGGTGGDGGYIRIEAGDSATTGGVPGYIDINGGINYLGVGGYVDIRGGQGHTTGGDANITGGYGYNVRGGNVNIWGGGSANGQINEGNVNIQTGGKTWTYDPSGNLTIPGGGAVWTIGTGTSALTANFADPYKVNLGLDYASNTATLAGANSVVIESNTGANTNQWSFYTSGNLTLPNGAVIKDNAGNAVAFGENAGLTSQGNSAVAIGVDAGENNQGFISIAIGAGAGGNGQGQAAVAIGTDTGANIQGIEAIAIGFKAGNQGQGQQSIAIGAKAGNVNQGNNSIILNATGDPLNQTTANTFTVAPVRNDVANIAEVMFYNATSKEVTYGNTISVAGNITGGNIIGNGNTLSNVAIKTSGSWTLANGVNTVNISVPLNGTYSIWVNGNIPNGIITYTATAVVTNNNVPVLGSSYGWYYAAGNALVLTSIPTQFVGTVNNISNAVIVTTTANVFTFGITNNSGNTAVVNWGYTKL